MSSSNFSSVAAFIWSVADVLRGDFKQSQYGRIILPFTLLRRLECVLAKTKPAVLEKFEQVKNMPLEAQDKLLNITICHVIHFVSQVVSDNEWERLC